MRRFLGGLLILSGLAAAALFVVRSVHDVEGLVRVVRSSQQALLLELDRVDAADGIPGRSHRYLHPQQSPLVNRPRGGMSLYAPPSGTLLWKDVEILPGAVLRLRFSIDPLGAAPPHGALPPVRYGFRVELRGEDHETVPVLAEQELEASSSDGVLGPLVQVELADLASRIGERADVALITRRIVIPGDTPAAGDAPPALLPCWRHPVIESRGRRIRLEDLARKIDVVVDDLLATFGQASKTEGEVMVARRRLATVGGRLSTGLERAPVVPGVAPDGTEGAPSSGPGQQTIRVGGIDVLGGRPGEPVARAVTHPTVHAEPEFDPGQALSIPSGGPRPAVVFAGPGRATWEVTLPSEPSRLDFSIGLRDLAPVAPPQVAPGGARFRVFINDEVGLDERLEAGSMGWQDRSIDLARWAGRSVYLSLDVQPDPIEPCRFVSVSGHPLAGLLVHDVECLAVEAAVACPRVVIAREVHPRLSGSKRPNVIMIVVETLRADHLGCYDPSIRSTPNIDRLAASGRVYERASSASSWTLPSVASILTGLDPVSHGVVDELHSFLSEEIETLPEILQREGVETLGLVTNDLLSAEKNFDQGFSTYAVPAYGNAHQTNQLLYSWLADHRDLQFFAYIHYYDPHGPYNAPGALREKHVPVDLRDLEGDQAQAAIVGGLLRGDLAGLERPMEYLEATYRGEVEYLDGQIGALLARLEEMGLSDKTYIVFTSDHGEEFGEHGWYGHGGALHAESVHVPLILTGPGIRPGRCGGTVETRRLFSTVLDWLGIEHELPERCPSLDLDEAQELRGYAICSTSKGIASMKALSDPLSREPGLLTLHSIEDAHWKLICAAVDDTDGELTARGLYHMTDDPAESRNRLAEEPLEAARLQKMLTAWLSHARARAMATWAGEMSGSTRARLMPKGPGYWGGR